MTASETIADNGLKLMFLTKQFFLLHIYTYLVINNRIVWFIPGHNDNTESDA